MFIALAACGKSEEKTAGDLFGTPTLPGSPATAGSAASGSAAAPDSAPAAAAAPAAADSKLAVSSPGADKPFKVGDTVYGQWTNRKWYPGRIGEVHPDGTFRVNYNDGDVSNSLPPSQVRPRKAAPVQHGGERSSASTCGRGLRQCGGRCVDILNDNRNCNSCGRICPEACMGGSCVSNHYKYGN
jgi:hypothetical protein